MLIAIVCFYLSAENQADSLQLDQSDTGASFVPDPNRIAQKYIKMIRSLEQLDTSEQIENAVFALTLDDAIQKMITGNKDVQKARLEYLIGEKRFLATFGAFEPYFVGTHEYSEADRPDAILIEMRESLKTGVEGVLPSATRYSLSLIQKDYRYTQSTLDWPTISSALVLTQPLLKDFLGNGPLSEIKIARTERQIVYNRYRSTLMAQCYDLENTYWKLVYLQEKKRNAEKSVKIAHQIVNESRTLVASGIISKLDAVEVSSQLAQRQTTLLTVKLEHSGVKNELMQMIGLPPDSALLPMTAITPLLVSSKNHIADSASLKEIDSLLSLNQPELLSAEFSRIRSRLNVAQMRGKALPELNLTGTLGISGANKIFNNAVDQFLAPEQNNHNWAIAVELKVPLGSGIRERNLLKAEKLNQKITELEKNSLKNDLTIQSMLIVDRIHDLSHNLSNAAVVVEYRTSLLQSEMVRLRAGLSNVRKIFEMEEELANARESELEMRVQYNLTISLYDRLLGLTLKRRGLENIVNGKPELIEDLTRE